MRRIGGGNGRSMVARQFQPPFSQHRRTCGSLVHGKGAKRVVPPLEVVGIDHYKRGVMTDDVVRVLVDVIGPVIHMQPLAVHVQRCQRTGLDETRAKEASLAGFSAQSGGGRIVDPALADQLIREGKIDMVAVGLAQLADPEWCNKSMEGREAEIRRCIGCTEGCYDKVIDPKAKHITCTRNPALCLEYKGLPKPEKAKNVMVIGAGIGGLMAAEYLKARGHNPTVYEATDAPGGHFVLAGKAPKKQAFTDAVMWDAEECKRMGIEIKTGVTVTPELIKEVKPDHVIVATGAHFVAPNIPGLDTAKDVYMAEDVLAGKAMPHGETIILGGGGVGCETAQFLIEHGVTDVRVMDSKRVGNKMGMLRTMFLDIEYPGETIKKSRGSKITAVGDHEITYAFTNKAKKTVEKTRHFDSLVIATGMHSRPTQELTDACSELGIPCDVIGSAKKADMGIEATADAYAAAMNV